jgi:hypothetical protein
MALTEDQRYENYLTLQRCIQNLRSGEQMAVEWNQKHTAFFADVRAFFKNFNFVYCDNDCEELRKKCSELEALAQYTERFVKQNGSLDYSAYRLF